MRKLTITQEDYNRFKSMMIADIDKQLRKKDTTEIKLNYKLDSAAQLTLEKKDRPLIIFTPIAWLKLSSMIANQSQEFALHGIVERDGVDFIIKDVMCYPQEVTSVTVTATDDYGPWLHQFDDDTFNSIRCQMHSHVNMPANPSGVDYQMYHDFLQGIKDYYIFLIINKSHKVWANIYDIEADVLYEDTDIDYEILIDEQDTLVNWISKQTKHIIKPKTTYTHTQYTRSNTYDYEDYDYGYGSNKTQRPLRSLNNKRTY